MKTLLLILLSFISVHSIAQIKRVKFTDATFENGMLYPIAQISGADDVASKINADILEKIKDLKDADFCVGQYGFVQKGPHIQIHIFCNCIDFKESQNRYYLYNIETGENVQYSDILTPNKMKASAKYLKEVSAMHIKTNSISIEPRVLKLIDSNNIDAFKVTFKRDGLDLWLLDKNWGDKPMFITWGAMRSYMKYSFL